LQQPGIDIDSVRGVETVQRRQRASGGDFEGRAIAVSPAKVSCPVEVPVTALHQSGLRVLAVRAVEAVQCRQCAPGGDFEDHAPAAGPSIVGCSIEVPVSGLHQPVRVTVASVGLKLCSVVSTPAEVILKTVPKLLDPPPMWSHRSFCQWLARARPGAGAVRIVEIVQRR
jgi:hypothetical protein